MLRKRKMKVKIQLNEQFETIECSEIKEEPEILKFYQKGLLIKSIIKHTVSGIFECELS